MNNSFLWFDSTVFYTCVLVVCVVCGLSLFRKAVRQREEEALDLRLRQISTPLSAMDTDTISAQNKNWIDQLVRLVFPKKATDPLVGKMPLQNTAGSDLAQSDYKIVLSQWGIDHSRERLFLVFGKIIGMLIFVITFLIINELCAFTETGSLEWITIFFAFLIGGTFFPRILTHVIVSKKRNEIERLAPDIIDLLMLSVEAGMTFDNALVEAKTALALYSKNISNELELFSADLAILPSRSDAFTNLINRTGSNTLRYLSVALSQGEKYGTPIAASLRIVASESRKLALIQTEKKAAKLPVYLSVPLMIFILPPVVVVSAGPGFVALMRSFGGAG